MTLSTLSVASSKNDPIIFILSKLKVAFSSVPALSFEICRLTSSNFGSDFAFRRSPNWSVASWAFRWTFHPHLDRASIVESAHDSLKTSPRTIERPCKYYYTRKTTRLQPALREAACRGLHKKTSPSSGSSSRRAFAISLRPPIPNSQW